MIPYLVSTAALAVSCLSAGISLGRRQMSNEVVRLLDEIERRVRE